MGSKPFAEARVLLNHTLTQTHRVLLNRVEPDLSGQGTAESRRDVEPASVPTDESNGDPVEVSAESRRDIEPAPVPTDESNGDPVEVSAESRRDVEPAPVPTDESNGDPVEVSAESRPDIEPPLFRLMNPMVTQSRCLLNHTQMLNQPCSD